MKLRQIRTRARALVPAVLLVCAGGLAAAPPAGAVVGGTVSHYGPWAVRLLIDGKPECTGTAISRQWILSAAHCFYEQAKPVADRRISFRVGNLDERRGTTVRPLKGKRIGSGVADMMLIKVPVMRNVTPIRLSPVPVRVGQRVRQYGWGATCEGDENRCQSPVLKQSDLTVIRASDPRCMGSAAPGGPDFCMHKDRGIPAGGDSGGPVTTVGPRGTEELVGVFDSSDRDTIAGAGEVSRQFKWILAGMAR